MITWGINASSHDSALSVFRDKELLFASQSERFSKIKNDSNLDHRLIDYAVKFGLPDKIILNEKNYLKNIRKLFFGGKIKKELKVNLTNKPKVESVYHHESHAAFGYYTSPFKKCVVLVIDAIGEFDCLSIWQADDNKLKKIKSFWYPNSIGLFYSAMTHRINLKSHEEEYILMGLAAFGDPMKYKKIILNDFFKDDLKLKVNLHRGCRGWNKVLKEKEYKHIAAATQSIYEDYLRMIMLEIKKINFSDNLVFTGGCALNCTANRIAYEYMHKVHIPCNPGDAGSAIGAVLAKTKERIKLDNNFLGYEIKKSINVKDVVKELLKNNICGLAVGKAEFGPRALGHRSLLANPNEKNIVDKLNKFKKRQSYRPFAIAVLKEEAKKHFQMFNDESPYMQYTYHCREKDMRDICHVDMTSRIQTVDEKNPIMYELLKEWYHKTKTPYLINTSLNIKGQPILNDENDIIDFEKKYEVKVF
jgi:carbamoyltransferase